MTNNNIIKFWGFEFENNGFIEISDVYQFETKQGKVRIEGAKFVFSSADGNCPIGKADFSICVKMTAIRKVVKTGTIRDKFSNWFYFSNDDEQPEDFGLFLIELANFCAEEIKKTYA